MAYADAIRTVTPTMENVATLIEGIASSSYPLTFGTWSPTWSGSGTLTYTSVTGTCKYVQIGKLILFTVAVIGTAAGTGNVIQATTPAAPDSSNTGGAIWIQDGGTWQSGAFYTSASENRLNFYKIGAGNFTAGSVQLRATLFYEAA